MKKNDLHNRILLVTEYLSPNFSAASEIVYRIANVLHGQFSYDVHILGFDDNSEKKPARNQNGITELSIKSISDFNRTVRTCNSNKLKLLLGFISSPLSFLHLFRQKYQLINKAYIPEIRRLNKKYHYDCIVAFHSPRESIFAISKLNLKCPCICYMLDPFAEYYKYSQNKKFAQIEKEAFSKASAIIMAKSDYFAYTDQDLTRKLQIIDFPNIIEYPRLQERKFDPDHIHMVFSGSLYADIRNPRYTIELLSKFINEKVIFHIVGCREGERGIPDRLPSNVICHGRVSGNEALAYMQSADILVNIGNTVVNQIPSKILTYISLGKPILNIYKTTNCPTLQYLDKYPAAINVLETPTVQKDTIDKVRNFINTSDKTQIPFSQIKDAYYNCTPEYVGKRLHSVINDVINDDRSQW